MENSFRGTDNGKQLVDELLHASSVPFPGHSGVAAVRYFLEAFQQLAPGIYRAYLNAIQQYPNAPVGVYVYGN